jgi:hypothetical protein
VSLQRGKVADSQGSGHPGIAREEDNRDRH